MLIVLLQFTSEPFTPFRLFYYPSEKTEEAQKIIENNKATHNKESWGVGVHTDYGVLTILAQDDIGGLQVQNKKGEWIEAPPIPGTFVVNIGDMVCLLLQHDIEQI